MSSSTRSTQKARGSLPRRSVNGSTIRGWQRPLDEYEAATRARADPHAALLLVYQIGDGQRLTKRNPSDPQQMP